VEFVLGEFSVTSNNLILSSCCVEKSYAFVTSVHRIRWFCSKLLDKTTLFVLNLMTRMSFGKLNYVQYQFLVIELILMQTQNLYEFLF
jgi:hypothetical protein